MPRRIEGIKNLQDLCDHQMKPLAKQICVILLTSAILAGVSNLVHPRRIPWVQSWGRYMEARAAKEQIEAVPFHKALELLLSGSHLFADARPAAEYLQGRIQGAVSLPFDALDENLETLERVLEIQRPAVVYCRNRDCDDALMLALELRAMGKSNLVLYVDGFEIWEAAGAPVGGPCRCFSRYSGCLRSRRRRSRRRHLLKRVLLDSKTDIR